MNRAKRSCAYRDCNINNIANPERTLFRFPKDELRAKKWSEIAQSDPIQTGVQFMCDLHFSRIYMCFSARRKMLLNTAVPFPYGSQAVVDTVDMGEEVQSSSQEPSADEEHLNDSMEDGELTGEVVYMDVAELEDENDSKYSLISNIPVPVTAGKKSPSKEIIIDKPSTITSNSVVSSSSSRATSVPNAKPITPAAGTILRRVKIKKRPSTAMTTSPTTGQTKSIVIKKLVKVSGNSALGNALAARLESSTSTPAKVSEKVCNEPAEKIATSVQPASSSSPRKSQEIINPSGSPKKEKFEDSIYEFIFKGEEYIQLPKASYEKQKRELEQKLEQWTNEKNELQRKLRQYKQLVFKMKQVLEQVSDSEEQ